MTLNCTNPKGHCWHTADGAVFQRHAAAPVAMVDTHCCDCDLSCQQQGHAKHVVKRNLMARTEHGDYAKR